MILIILIPVITGLLVGTILTNDFNGSKSNTLENTCNERKVNNNRYISEYLIPDSCSAPIAITTDNNGIVWFIQNNNSKLVSFNPSKNTFTDYTISNYYQNIESWSILSLDDEIWFTDHKNNFIWRFYKQNNSFVNYRLETQNSYPVQIIKNTNNHLIVSEIFGKKIAIVDPNQTKVNSSKGIIEIQPQIELEVLGGIAVDSNNTIWFTMLTWPIEGYLGSYKDNQFNFYELPEGISSPVGIAINNNNIWINDHGSSQFVVMNLINKSFTKFVTSSSDTYYSTTLPYWNKFDTHGNLWLNIHQANTIGKFDLNKQILIEYEIPTKNGDWGGISNHLQFDIDKQGNIWFTEWTENKIGFLDANKPLDFSVTTSTREISLKSDTPIEFFITIDPIKRIEIDIKSSGTFSNNGKLENISVSFEPVEKFIENKYQNRVIIESQNLDPGIYTIMISVKSESITQSIPIRIIQE